MARSTFLVAVGVLAYLALYFSQAVLLTLILVQNLTRNYWFFILGYVPSLIYMLFFFCQYKVADDDKTVRHVVAIWLLYICGFIAVVATIFFTVVEDLSSSSDDLGPNVLRSMLCFAPGLLILLLNITISPEHFQFILTLSVTTALDLFDGIEMLEIILVLSERDLKDGAEVSIIVFACFSFLVSPITLLQHKITPGDTKPKKKMVILRILVQRFLINLPFLVIRGHVWAEYNYESTVFIAKNIIALVVGMLELIVSCDCFTCLHCGPDPE